MKPNFESITTFELKAYVLSHRDDLDAIDALVNRRSPDSEAFSSKVVQITNDT